MKELRIFGPPGTGKTTRLATEEIPKAVDKFGPDKTLVTSFTKAAAREIATKPSRITGESIFVEPGNVGTLHSLCYHQLGGPVIAETMKEEWNTAYPGCRMVVSARGAIIDNGIDEHVKSEYGDELLGKLNIARARLIPKKKWSSELRRFEKKWAHFKKLSRMMDFTDLIENAIHSVHYPPNDAKVIFVDEAQDFTALQFKLIRRWARHVDWLVLCGDDDQCQYQFCGADPDMFLNPPVDDKYKRILTQSFRVPRKILLHANAFIKNVRNREPKDYQPRVDKIAGKVVDGNIRRLNSNYKRPEGYIDEIIEISDSGKTAMVLASCSYIIDPVKKVLKDKGVPFHNPYRRRRGDWNPLIQSRNGNFSPANVLLNFLDCGVDTPYWNAHQLISWADNLRVGETGLIYKQGKAILKAVREDLAKQISGLHSTQNMLHQILSPNAIEPALNRDVSWLMDNIQQKSVGALKYAEKVFEQYGMDGLTKPPKIILGTIHSVKGGEADCVFLHPDISSKARRASLLSREASDALIRMFYVGMTRAREDLILIDPVRRKSRRRLYMDLS